MLQLTNISLVQFKNYQNKSFDFNERIIGVCGKNGIGKTNLLDAIYYLSFTKSYFSKSDQSNVQHGRSGFRIAGEFHLDNSSISITCILRETGKKEFLYNGKPYDKFSDHIGKFPSVIIAPDDVFMITGGSEERRRFLDALFSQMDKEYLLKLIEYNKVLQQRNGLLRSAAERRTIDHDLLQTINEQLIRPGQFIFEKRKIFLEELIPSIAGFYSKISGETYDLKIEYESQLLNSDFKTLLERTREKDIYLQRTNAGIHKDDLQVTLYENPFKIVASQGQRKSLLFAMKLAEFEALKKRKDFSPILLLDDVFEKLDDSRMRNLLDYVCRKNEGQIFLTDTHCNRLKPALDELAPDYQIIQL